MTEQITLNGHELWAHIAELDGGLRMRLSLDDWERIDLCRGQRIPLRRAGRPEEWLFLAEVVERPPLAWVVLASRVMVVG